MKENLSLDDFLCFSIYKTNRVFGGVNKEMLKATGLTYPQFLVMVSLWGNDEQTVGSLGKAVMLETSTLTPLLKRLETQGLVTRKRDPNDERSVVVSLTDVGSKMRKHTEGMTEVVLEKTGLTLPEFNDLKRKINDLGAALAGSGN